MRRPLDAYYTPDALAVAIVRWLGVEPGEHVYEPHAGGGAFVRALRDAGAYVRASDVDEEAAGLREAHAWWVRDFVVDPPVFGLAPSMIVGNPPYAGAEQHVRRALAEVRPMGRVAFLLRIGFLASMARSALFRAHPVCRVGVVVPRPSFTGGGSDSSEYAVLVWGGESRPVEHIVWR